jgi:hypothetical protein
LKLCHCFKGKSSSEAINAKQFRKHYGSSPLDLSDMWYDLTTTNIPGAELGDKDKSAKGFKMFMAAHHFLWTYPKNSYLFASRFLICETYARGEHLWRWIKKIQALKAKKIVWDDSLNDQNTEIFCVSVDGTDFRIWEKKHPTMPVDTGMCSVKFKHGAVKYELGISVFRPKLVWMNGPFRGGEHDLTIFRGVPRLDGREDSLKAKIRPGKMVIADRGYASNTRSDEMGLMATPNDMDPKELKNFKSRVRCRHETFNGRLKAFKCLSETFRHGIEKHKIAFEALCVIVQYQMDNGSEIYAA